MSMSADRFARLEIKENPKQIAPKKVTLAFGRQGVDKLVRCLRNKDVDIILHALKVLDTSILKVQKNIILFLQYHGVEAANDLTLMPDERVVLLSVKCLVHVAAVNTGCVRMLETKTLDNVKHLLSDEDTSVLVKLGVYALLQTLSSRLECVKKLLKEGLLDFLLQQIDTEEDPRLKSAAMGVIANCGRLPANPREEHKLVQQGGVAAVLAAGDDHAVAACVELLKHEDQSVVANAANILQVCSLTEFGRDHVVEAGAVKVMTHLLIAPNGAVRRAVSSALLSLTISEKGKKQFHRLLGCTNLINRLSQETSPDVMQNVIKIVSAMCCWPAARKQLKDDGAPAILQCIASESRNETTKSIAQLANENVLWEP